MPEQLYKIIVGRSVMSNPNSGLFQLEVVGKPLETLKLNADLRHTDLRHADLRGAELIRADFHQVDLTLVNLNGVDLSQAKNVNLPNTIN